MQTIKTGGHAFGMGDLAQLRKSIVWSSAPENDTMRTGALVERLEEVLVMELHKDGGRSFLSFTVRGLYKHVLSAITSKISGKRERDEVNSGIQKKGGPMQGSVEGGTTLQGSMGDSLTNPVVLGSINTADEAIRLSDIDASLEISAASLSQVSRDATNPVPATVPPPRSVHSHSRNKSIGGADPGQQNTDQVTYRERLGGYLHPRDMRRLVTPFSASNEPGLIVRRHVMLLNFDPMRAVILRDRLLIIVPDGADSILNQVETRVRGGIREMERSFLGGTAHGSDKNDIGTSEHSIFGKRIRLRKTPHSKSDISAQYSQRTTSDDEFRQAGHSNVPSETATEHTQVLDEDNADQQNEYDEWNDLQGTEWIDLPFELQCTDAVLHTVSSFLQKDTIELQEASKDYIIRILKDSTGTRDDPLTIIRAIKEAVREMNGRVNGFVQSLNRILDEDEDMALMNLSRLQTHPERFMYPVTAEILEEESDEPELILESYLQEGLSLINVLDSIQGQIDTTAELVDQRLDSVRNRILMANMVLTAVSVSFSAASLVGSLWGMNVPVPYESDDTAFLKIVFSTLGGMIGICCMILVSLFYSGTMPKLGLSAD